jgi:hypothetical protein
MSEISNIGKIKLTTEEFLILAGILALNGDSLSVEQMKKYDNKAAEIELNIEKNTVEKANALYSKHVIQKGSLISGAKKIAMKKELYELYDDYSKKYNEITSKYKD